MAVSTNGRRMKDAAAALCGIVVRPSTTLCSISEHPAKYLAPSVAVLAAGTALGIPFTLNSYRYPFDDFTWGVSPSSLVVMSVQSLLLILGIFWVGRRWGGARSLRRAFPALAYCLVPGILGVVATTVLRLYASPALDAVPDLAPAPFLDFAGSTIAHVSGWFFAGWAFLLKIKAIRILNGFGYARSVAVLALAILIVYAVNIIHGISITAFDEFVMRA